MNQEIEKTKKNFFTSLDRTASVQLFMIAVVIFAYVLFLILQRYLFSFEDLTSKLIVVNILLAVGIAMEIGYFIWTMYNKKRKLEKKMRDTEAKSITKENG